MSSKFAVRETASAGMLKVRVSVVREVLPVGVTVPALTVQDTNCLPWGTLAVTVMGVPASALAGLAVPPVTVTS